MEDPSLGGYSGLQLLAYATATAMPDSSRVYDLYRVCDFLQQQKMGIAASAWWGLGFRERESERMKH